MSNIDIWPCFGLSVLGQCQYNPSAAPIYFGLGDIVAALAFTLAVQQLLKPVYNFRLQARRVRMRHIYALVSLAAVFVVLSAAVPHIQILSGPLSYPIVYELIAVTSFLTAYAILISCISIPVTARNGEMHRFAIAAGNLLSEADETARVDFGEDLFLSLPNLVQASQIAERQRTTAFFDFAFRHQIRDGSWAASILQISADPPLCQALVSRSPWRVARAMRTLAERKLHSRSSEDLVQELAWQAITTNDSMMAREVGYQGFANADILSTSMFGDLHILTAYNPFEKLAYRASVDLHDAGTQKRFEKAAKLALQTLLPVSNPATSPYALWRIASFYEMSAQALWTEHERAMDRSSYLISGVSEGGRIATAAAELLMSRVSAAQYQRLYADPDEPLYQLQDALSPLVKIVVDAIQYASNNFVDHKHQYWMVIYDLVSNVFPAIGDQPNGMSPFQQRVAISLLKKVDENLRGFYPAAMKALLATVGPYRGNADQLNITAFRIFRDSFYYRLKGINKFKTSTRATLEDFLPANVAFDAGGNTLTHRYLFGEERITHLSRIRPRLTSLQRIDVARDQDTIAFREHMLQ